MRTSDSLQVFSQLLNFLIFVYFSIENFEKFSFLKSLRRTLPKFPSEILIMQSS